jgi:radical SAM superfamily enzyme YgiQ (UPF0313 family)
MDSKNGAVQPDETVKPELSQRGKYGMYTEEGNKEVEKIINKVRAKRSRYDMINVSDSMAMIELGVLSKKYSEAKDDEVKFIVLNGIRKRN